MAQLQAVRGTQDLLPAEARRHRTVIETARKIAERYGFGEIATPIFEFTEVFSRPIGETTDVVSKEMYTFKDRGGEEITLRPEYTAGIARAVLSNGLTQATPLKFFGAGPMFRYERPQKGRYRQFHQIDAELIGAAQPQADVEVIAMGAAILDELGVLKSCRLELNTLGDTESRTAYRAALVEYFTRHLDKLSDDSRDRLGRNPLRILDSKDEGDKAIVADAPAFSAYLTDPAKAFFDEVKRGLDALDIAYELNPRLVRGLDYYCHTAFEFITTELGSQGTVLGGGRYDGLMAMMGGPALPAVGWAGGIERLSMLIAEPPAPARPIAVIPVGEAAELEALKLTQRLRGLGHVVDLGYSGNVGKRMKRADKIEARVALVLGEDELARGAVTFRDLDAGSQEEVPLDGLAERLKGLA
ncbi:histidine--tRNA ligase [Aliidongia dinghuensis]|uniref:Histidine--tRNA ligase n=1 Tax=Aliidongia dinghuensis TaxID=1867774 RepID=A0A8J2YPJ9_9PROT|nr:histidine--tRNA ligase [Aliidongia dinghuensis]GGF00122.1 histidine--tRNA ligase [Aliidongia dinghuensis]